MVERKKGRERKSEKEKSSGRTEMWCTRTDAACVCVLPCLYQKHMRARESVPRCDLQASQARKASQSRWTQPVGEVRFLTTVSCPPLAEMTACDAMPCDNSVRLQC